MQLRFAAMIGTGSCLIKSNLKNGIFMLYILTSFSKIVFFFCIWRVLRVLLMRAGKAHCTHKKQPVVGHHYKASKIKIR